METDECAHCEKQQLFYYLDYLLCYNAMKRQRSMPLTMPDCVLLRLIVLWFVLCFCTTFSSASWEMVDDSLDGLTMIITDTMDSHCTGYSDL
jgi:hypothetical protein